MVDHEKVNQGVTKISLPPLVNNTYKSFIKLTQEILKIDPQPIIIHSKNISPFLIDSNPQANFS